MMNQEYERVGNIIQVIRPIVLIDNYQIMWYQYMVVECQQNQSLHILALKICESINPQTIIEIEVNSTEDQSSQMFIEAVKVNKDILISSSASVLQMFYAISLSQIKIFSEDLRIFQTVNEIKTFMEQQKQKTLQKAKFINKDSHYKTSYVEIKRLKGIIFDKDKKIKQLEKENNQLRHKSLRLADIQDLHKKAQQKLLKERLQHERSKQRIIVLQNLVFNINKQRQNNSQPRQFRTHLNEMRDDIIKENRWYEEQLQIKSNKIKMLELQIHQLRKGFNNRSSNTMG